MLLKFGDTPQELRSYLMVGPAQIVERNCKFWKGTFHFQGDEDGGVVAQPKNKGLLSRHCGLVVSTQDLSAACG